MHLREVTSSRAHWAAALGLEGKREGGQEVSEREGKWRVLWRPREATKDP